MTPKAFNRRAIPSDATLREWLAPDGWAYRRMEWPRPQDTAARGSILFAGGRGDFIEKYLEVQNHWHERGWNVSSFDWRSQGGSRGDIKAGHLESLDPLVDDLAALIAAWREEVPGPHVVVAHSMGGHVLLRVLAERAPAIDAAVAVAPMVQINSAPLPGFAAAATAQSMTALGFGRTAAWSGPEVPEPVGSARQGFLTGCAERYEDELFWWGREPGFNLGTPSWGWLNAAYRSCALLTDAALAKVKVPVLFVATERDRLVSAPEIRRAAGAIPDAELLMFEDAAHEILREIDSVRLKAFARIDRFLEEHAGG
jgi:lysophospholipase